MMHEQMQVRLKSFDSTCKTPLGNLAALAEEQHDERMSNMYSRPSAQSRWRSRRRLPGKDQLGHQASRDFPDPVRMCQL